MLWSRKIPSLVDLCVAVAIDNVQYLGDVGETDIDLLGKILPHCTVDQLTRIEKSTQERDLSPVTNKLWKQFYEKEFGIQETIDAVNKMKKMKVSYKWKLLYEKKLDLRSKAEEESINRMRDRYKKEDNRKQSRQVQPCTKIPPSSKRRFFGDSGPGYSGSGGKGNLMKKAKIEFMKCREVKNLAAMKKNVVQKNHSTTSSIRPAGFFNKDAASSSKLNKPRGRF